NKRKMMDHLEVAKAGTMAAAGEVDLFSYGDIRARMIADARPHEEYVSTLPTFGELNFVFPELANDELLHEVDSQVLVT
ncbi:MAG: hypothetical protein AAF497_10520, partial [Planctomycetota bacterium]